MPQKTVPSAAQDRIVIMPLAEIRPSPENDRLYRPIDAADPEIRQLATSIRQHGVREPLVITRDHFILSGHRRHSAAVLAGLSEVPVRIEPIRREDDPDQFLVLLREYNRQRDKSHDEKLREELVTVDPDTAYTSLIAHRAAEAEVHVETIQLGAQRKRSKFRKEKHQFRDAVIKLVYQYRKHWPLTDRRIHYYLLNDPPIKNTRLGQRYQNDVESYDRLTDMVTRLRLDGSIPFGAITDETRPIETWHVHQCPRSFIRNELDEFGRGYWRDLLQSQPNHIELLCEKNTVWPTVRRVAMQYCIPVTSGRGHSSLDPRYQMAQRYQRSGKEQLIVIIAADFDPAGECIAESFARSMRDDFDIEQIVPIKAALTHEQTETLDVHVNGMPTKEKDGQRKTFERKFGVGQKCYELEAILPETLEQILTETIDSVIDREAFNRELDAERADAAWLATLRKHVVATLGESFVDMPTKQNDES